MAQPRKAMVAQPTQPVVQPKVEAPQEEATELKNQEKLQQEVDLCKAEQPSGVEPIEVKFDEEMIIKQAYLDFEGRASTTALTTQEMVDSTKKVLDLIASGAQWDDSEELRQAFKKVPNQFAKGPVISIELQIMCGKIAKFDTSEVPIYRTGVKVGGRWVYQDDLGFMRTLGRLAISLAEAEGEEGKTPDHQGVATYLSHCPITGVDFWATEPQHQIHSPVGSKTFKKPSGSTRKIDTEEQLKDSLSKRLATYERLLANASDVDTKKTAQEKIKMIKAKLSELDERAA